MFGRILMLARRNPAETAIVAVGLALGLWFTWGMAASFDSVRYANVGHWIAAGEGISSSITTVPVQDGTKATGDGLHAFTIQPPGLPLFYAATGAGNWTASHRILHVLCYGALALIVLRIARMTLGGTAPAVFAALLAVASPVVVDTAGHYWTDLPFAVLLLGGLWAVLRAGEADRSWWRWLLLASVLAALAVGFRVAGLALGAVFLLDGIVGIRRRGARHALLRLLVAGSAVVPAAAVLFLRNLALSGHLRGTVPTELPPPVAPSLVRSWNFLASRILEAFVPEFAGEGAIRKAAEANATPTGWVAAGVLVAVMALAGLAVAVLRRRGALRWPAATARDERPAVPAGLAATLLVAACLLLYLLPLAKFHEYHVTEARFLAPVAPLLWLPVVAVLCGSGRRAVDLALGGLVTVVFLVGAVAAHEPYRHVNRPLRAGLDWIAGNVPVEAPILTNVGKVLLDEDISRRVYHISDWHFRSVLPQRMRGERGLRNWAAERDVQYVMLVGTPNPRQQIYWGEAISGLYAGRLWPDRLLYRDRYVRVYDVPAPGEAVRSGRSVGDKGAGGR